MSWAAVLTVEHCLNSLRQAMLHVIAVCFAGSGRYNSHHYSGCAMCEDLQKPETMASLEQQQPVKAGRITGQSARLGYVLVIILCNYLWHALQSLHFTLSMVHFAAVAS